MTNRKKGFTILEMVIVLALVAILSLVLYSALRPMLGTNQKITETVKYSEMTTEVLEQLRGQLKYAKEINYTNPLDGSGVIMANSQEILYVKDTTTVLFDQDYFEDLEPVILFKNEGDYSLLIRITLLRDDEVVYEAEDHLELVNMKLNGIRVPSGYSEVVWYQ